MKSASNKNGLKTPRKSCPGTESDRRHGDFQAASREHADLSVKQARNVAGVWPTARVWAANGRCLSAAPPVRP